MHDLVVMSSELSPLNDTRIFEVFRTIALDSSRYWSVLRLTCKRFSEEFTKEALLDALCVTCKREENIKGTRILSIQNGIVDYVNTFEEDDVDKNNEEIPKKCTGFGNIFGRMYFVGEVNYDLLVQKYDNKKGWIAWERNHPARAFRLKMFDGIAFRAILTFHQGCSVNITQSFDQHFNINIWKRTTGVHTHAPNKNWPKKCFGCPVAKYLTEGYRKSGSFFKNDSEMSDRQNLRHIAFSLAPEECKIVVRGKMPLQCLSFHKMNNDLFCEKCNKDYSNTS